MGLGLRFRLLLYGFGVGRIRVHNQFDPAVRASASDHGQVFHEALCGLQLHVYLGNAAGYADSVCGVSACSIRGAYGFHGAVLLDAGIASYSLQLLLHFPSLLSFHFTLPQFKKKKCLTASFLALTNYSLLYACILVCYGLQYITHGLYSSYAGYHQECLALFLTLLCKSVCCTKLHHLCRYSTS